jgi:hypothetical protein
MASRKSSTDDDMEAQSMSPHLVKHATRGQEAGKQRTSRGREETKTQKSIHGILTLPPDEATPFFDTYVLKYAFPTIAIICRYFNCPARLFPHTCTNICQCIIQSVHIR